MRCPSFLQTDSVSSLAWLVTINHLLWPGAVPAYPQQVNPTFILQVNIKQGDINDYFAQKLKRICKCLSRKYIPALSSFCNMLANLSRMRQNRLQLIWFFWLLSFHITALYTARISI